MSINSIIAGIDAEIARLEQARTALSSVDESPTKALASAKKPAKRKLSAKARKAIAVAQKARWAKVRAAAKAKKAPTKKAAKAPEKEPRSRVPF